MGRRVSKQIKYYKIYNSSGVRGKTIKYEEVSLAVKLKVDMYKQAGVGAFVKQQQISLLEMRCIRLLI